MRELDYIFTPKTRQQKRDLERVHDKLKRTSSLKAFTEALEKSRAMIVDPHWLEKCFEAKDVLPMGDLGVWAPPPHEGQPL